MLVRATATDDINSSRNSHMSETDEQLENRMKKAALQALRQASCLSKRSINNYGFEMREKEKLKHLIAVLKSFLKAAAAGAGSLDEFILDRGDAALSVSASSMNQTSSYTNSAYPLEGAEEEEKKAPIEATRLNIS